MLREARLLNHRLSKLESLSPKTAQLCEIEVVSIARFTAKDEFGQVLLRSMYSKNTYTSQNYKATMSRARLHQIEVCHVLPNVQYPVKTAQRNGKTQRCIQSHKFQLCLDYCS